MSHMGLNISLSTIVSNRERRSRRMKKQSTAYQRRLAALVAAAFLFAALGLLGYSLLAGGTPASAESPDRVHGRISEELESEVPQEYPGEGRRDGKGFSGQDAGEQEARTHRPCSGSGGRRARLRRPRERVREGPPRRCRPREGYRLSVANVANVYIAGHRVGYPGTREQPRVLGPRQAGGRGMRSSSRTPTERVTPTRYSRSV